MDCISVKALVKHAHRNEAVINKVHDYVMANDVLDIVQKFKLAKLELSVPSDAVVSDGRDRTYRVKRVEFDVSAVSAGRLAEFTAGTYVLTHTDGARVRDARDVK